MSYTTISIDEFKSLGKKGKKPSKYKNIKTLYDGIKFDSKKEAARYAELLLLVKAGLVKDLELQPKFLLADTVRWNGQTLCKRYYKADFQYVNEKGENVVEDCKGFLTDMYKIKRHLFLSLYPEYVFIET